jgi:hypothetical protein
MRHRLGCAVVFAVLTGATAFAQGTQTGTMTGEVRSEDNQLLPGATVSVQAASLQGVRTAVTDANGGYILKALPPGVYTLSFSFQGMKTVEKAAELELGRSITVNAMLSLASMQETLTVSTESVALDQSSVGANLRADMIDQLPTGRTLFGIAELAPNLTDRSPGGNLTLAGGFSYDNVFLINGVDVNDNAFGSPHNLFVEDAIDQVQVLTSAISAEYGRFGGGVINAITKRGGNEFSGSFRVDFTNPSWRDETPIEDASQTERTDITNKDYQATLGGPIVKDRLWFFLAGRTSDRTTDSTLLVTKIPYSAETSNDRLEAKLTGTIAPRHTVQGSYTRNVTKESGPALPSYAGDLDVFYDPPRNLPQHLFATNYNGVLSSNLFAEVQYSEKKSTLENNGGSSSDLVDSPIFTLTSEYEPLHYYNAPYFDNRDPEQRNNRQITANLSYFLSTSSLGRHDLKLGYENFVSTRVGGNSQSATGVYIYADYLGGPGTPTRDANGHAQPIFRTGENYLVQSVATRGAKIDITTQSLYINDRWQISRRFSASLGVRFEKVRSEATDDIVGADTTTLVPRLALSYDHKGEGKWRLDATYGEYSGRFIESQFGDNTVVTNPSYAYYGYTGPNGVGRSFAPGFDLRNYTDFQGGRVPTQNVKFDDDLTSPKTREMTFSIGRTLPHSGFVRLTYVDRDTSNFIETFRDTTTGDTQLVLLGQSLGTVDNVVYRNTDVPSREYRAVQFIGAARPTSHWRVDAGWTWQLRNHGDFEGEASATPGTASTFGDFPEVFFPSRHFPAGRLDDYQRHKIRLFSIYDLRLGRAGKASVGLLYRYNSGGVSSVTATNQAFSARQTAGRALYSSPPARSSNTIFFGPRGAEEFDGEHNIDASINYDIPVVKSVRPYFKLDVRNIFNGQAQMFGNTAVTADPTSALDEFGLRTGYIPTTNFRRASANGSYQIPRELRVSLGLRF